MKIKTLTDSEVWIKEKFLPQFERDLIERHRLITPTLLENINYYRKSEHVLARDILWSYLANKFNISAESVGRITNADRTTVMASLVRTKEFSKYDIRRKYFDDSMNFLSEKHDKLIGSLRVQMSAS